MLHTWLISHLSTTRFKCSFPLFCSHSGRWFLDSIHSWCCCVAGPDWFIQYSLVRLVRNYTTEPSSLAIPFGVYPSSSRVYITQLYVCVQCVGASEYVWICVSFGCFWHISFITFSQVIYGHTAAVVATSSSCVPHCLCVYGASLAGKINHVSKSRAYACTGRWMDGWMDG